MEHKIPKKYRINWIVFSHAYLRAAQAISEKVRSIKESKQADFAQVIPALFLLRHSFELAIKSILISYDQRFETEHNLRNLLKEAKKYIDLDSDTAVNFISEVDSLVEEFTKTTYGGPKRLFTNDDTGGTLLRYLQHTDFDNYTELKNIDLTILIGKVKRVVGICEGFTIAVEIDF